MDINDYLAKLQADIDSQLASMGLSNDVPSAKKPSVDSGSDDTPNSKFCPDCGTKMPAESNFCPNCGCKMNDYPSNEEDSFYEDEDEEEVPDSQLILVYSAIRLAEKYSIATKSVSNTMGRIQKLLNSNEVMVDLCNIDGYVAPNAKDWRAYSNAIRQYIDESMVVSMDSILSVMIIGGDDCIPMPRIDNPTSSGLKELHSDMLYCWKDAPISMYEDGDGELCMDYDKTDFNIARLPLENGNMHSSFEEDMACYFEKAMQAKDGIDVRNILMTSTASWIPASTAMVDKLPLISMRHVPEDAKRNGMFVSPAVSIENEDVLEYYEDSLENADMLLFNLHGSDERGGSCYYGQLGRDCFPEAFNTDLMERNSASIVNTVACFGARFVGYSRGDSMLLTAMYRSDSVVLFAGSCSTAFGRSGNVELDNIMSPTAFSETFMKLYVLYQLKGMPAGQAFLKAKCDYLNYFMKSEDLELCVGTILMFNLFGMPTLFAKPRRDVIDRVNGTKDAMLGKSTPKVVKAKIVRPEKKLLMHKESNPAKGILAELRDAVDTNLAAIRSAVEKNVYRQLGLTGRDLRSIESFTERKNGKVSKGYYFNYDQGSAHVKTKTFVKVDENGRVMDAIHTK